MRDFVHVQVVSADRLGRDFQVSVFDDRVARVGVGRVGELAPAQLFVGHGGDISPVVLIEPLLLVDDWRLGPKSSTYFDSVVEVNGRSDVHVQIDWDGALAGGPA